jgi:hypothetical protein
MITAAILAGVVLGFIASEYVRRSEDRAFTRGRLSMRLEHMGREGGK